MPHPNAHRSTARHSADELCELLLGVRRGEVFHPDLKRLLVHLGFAELRGLELALTRKGERLLQP